MPRSEWDPKARMGKVIYPIMKRVRVITTFAYEDGTSKDVVWMDSESFAGHMGVDKSAHITHHRHLERVWRPGDLNPTQVRDRGLFDLNLRLEYPSRIVDAKQLSMDPPIEDRDIKPENMQTRISHFGPREDR